MPSKPRKPKERPARIPLEHLFGGQTSGAPQVSPNGQHLAYVRPVQGTANLFIRELASGSKASQLTQLTGGGVYLFQWAMDSHAIVFREQSGGDENYRCQALDIESGERRILTPATGDQGQPVQALLGHQLNRNTSPRRPKVFLAAMNIRDRICFDLYAVDVYRGELELLAEGSRNLRNWLVDIELNVRGVLEETEDGGLSLAWCPEPGARPKLLVAWPAEDEMHSKPLAVTPRGRLLLLDSTGRDTAALIELDPASGERAVLLSDPDYDVGGIELDPATGELEAAWIQRDHREWTVFAERAASAYRRLEDEFAPGGFLLANRSTDNRKWVVWSNRSDKPYSAYLMDRERQALENLFASQPDLEAYEFAPEQPVSYRARDGLALHGYLTEPREFVRPGPLVLLVHGGPWARDWGAFDPEVQWLADRGYACLQVNFRGSTGYGKRSISLARREWGGRMQDDLSDAVGWAVNQGIADARRVAIMGQSYGGYAALAGAALTPGLYAGAVSLCGISNLLTMLANEVPHWESVRRRYESHVGKLPRYADGEHRGQVKPEEDLADAEAEEVRYLKSRSPLFQAHRVTCPVLLGHGANDPRSLVAESESFTAALREHGIEVELVIYPDEGHWLAQEKNRLDFYRRADDFLRRVLG